MSTQTYTSVYNLFRYVFKTLLLLEFYVHTRYKLLNFLGASANIHFFYAKHAINFINSTNFYFLLCYFNHFIISWESKKHNWFELESDFFLYAPKKTKEMTLNYISSMWKNKCKHVLMHQWHKFLYDTILNQFIDWNDRIYIEDLIYFAQKTIINAVTELDWNKKSRDRSWDVLSSKSILLNVKRSETLIL